MLISYHMAISMVMQKLALGPFQANCYILTDQTSGDVALIDPGYEDERLFSLIEGKCDKIKLILLTHRHFDHVMAVARLKEMCKNAQIVIHENDQVGLYDNDESYFNSCLSYYADGEVQKPTKATKVVKDGDVISFGSKDIKVMHTPGHSSGSVCYIIDNMMFSGDTLFKRSMGRVDCPSGSYSDMKKSLKRLAEIQYNYEVFPGHGESTQLHDEQINNPYMRHFRHDSKNR